MRELNALLKLNFCRLVAEFCVSSYGAVGLSAMCDCDISLSYSFIFTIQIHKEQKQFSFIFKLGKHYYCVSIENVYIMKSANSLQLYICHLKIVSNRRMILH